MSDHLRVDLDALASSTGAVATAVAALGAAEGALGQASTLALGALDGGAEDRAGAFLRQWREEVGLVADLLRAHDEVVARVVETYRALEAATWTALVGAGGPGPDGAGPGS